MRSSGIASRMLKPPDQSAFLPSSAGMESQNWSRIALSGPSLSITPMTARRFASAAWTKCTSISVFMPTNVCSLGACKCQCLSSYQTLS